MTPIFIGYTRSFWFGILPTLAVVVDLLTQLALDPETALPVATLISWATGLEADQVVTIMQSLAPVFALVIAHQRRGAARPYSLDPSAS